MKEPKSIAVMEKLSINRLFLLELQKMMFPKASSEVSIRKVLETEILAISDEVRDVLVLAFWGHTF